MTRRLCFSPASPFWRAETSLDGDRAKASVCRAGLLPAEGVAMEFARAGRSLRGAVLAAVEAAGAEGAQRGGSGRSRAGRSGLLCGAGWRGSTLCVLPC